MCAVRVQYILQVCRIESLVERRVLFVECILYMVLLFSSAAYFWIPWSHKHFFYPSYHILTFIPNCDPNTLFGDKYSKYLLWNTCRAIMGLILAAFSHIMMTTHYIPCTHAYTVQCTVYTGPIHFTVYPYTGVHCTLSVQYSVQYTHTLYTVQCTHTVYSVQCKGTLYTIHCTLYTVQCTVCLHTTEMLASILYFVTKKYRLVVKYSWLLSWTVQCRCPEQ